MQKRYTILLILCVPFLLFIDRTELGAASQGTNHLRLYLRQGIEKAFNLEALSANTSLQKAVSLDEDNPMGYAFLALAHLFAYEMSVDAKEREYNQQSMLYYASETLARGEKKIKSSASNGNAYLSMALAKIAKVRWAVMHNAYLVVAQDILNLWEYVEKGKGDQHNYDIYFPSGILRYHIDHLPSVARIFSAMFITPGDRVKGLQELELAAQHGDLLKDIARSELIVVYGHFEKQPARALPIVRELKAKYPRNFNFSFALANVLADLHRYEEAFAVAGEIEQKIRACKPPFGPHLRPRHALLMGRIFFTQSEYVKASEYFRRSLGDTSPYNARVRAWAFVRLGMIHDVRKERKKAEEYYNNALIERGGESAAQVEARKYLKMPYVPELKP